MTDQATTELTPEAAEMLQIHPAIEQLILSIEEALKCPERHVLRFSCTVEEGQIQALQVNDETTFTVDAKRKKRVNSRS